MPKFSYVAMDPKGKETKGTLEVASQNEAIGRVKEMGLFPTKIVEVDKAKEKAREESQAGAGQAGAARKRAMQHQHQDSRPGRRGEDQGAHHVHPAVGHAGGRRFAAVARHARAGKAGAQSRR